MIGAELKALRLAKVKTTIDLGEAAGGAHSHIVRIEAGRYGVAIDVVARIAEALCAEIKIVKNE